MWHATLRFSLDKDTASATRNAMAKILKPAGFTNTKTGTWEAYAMNSCTLAASVADALKLAEQSGKLDHLWTHIEQLSLRQKSKLLRAAKAIQPPAV